MTEEPDIGANRAAADSEGDVSRRSMLAGMAGRGRRHRSGADAGRVRRSARAAGRGS